YWRSHEVIFSLLGMIRVQVRWTRIEAPHENRQWRIIVKRSSMGLSGAMLIRAGFASLLDRSIS
ncbi:MAG: hypothetical protein KDE25_15265, partial [Novosphingobium sp.]|nr:hypothetical protein [Novosphingobium sp.]